MKGIYFRSVAKRQGLTDFGYYREEGDLPMEAERYGFDPGSERSMNGLYQALEKMVGEKEAYFVEVFGNSTGARVRLSQGKPVAVADIEGDIELQESGPDSTKVVSSREPVMPRQEDDWESMGEKIAVYADYALEGSEGIESGEFDWDILLEDKFR
ncbi:MAG: hypothetical protein ABEJ66_00555 [Candidatus Nanohaloarchaea archaeon]